MVSQESWARSHPTYKGDFATIIEQRLFSLEEVNEATELEFETEDILYAFLQEIFDYLYNDGPFPWPEP